jgi:hypothetical protein
MKGKRHSPEQIVRKLREADRLLAEGADADAVCRHLEVSVQPHRRAHARSARHACSQEDGADDTVNALEQIVERRGRAPMLIRSDNGPEFISQALRDWCRFNNAGHRLHRARRAPGRIRSLNPSTVTSDASCSTSNRSTACSKPSCS